MIPKIVVISTGFDAPTKHVCLRSIASQVGVEVEHRYVEASEQSPPKTCSQNVWEAAQGLSPESVVAWVDGDDWLAHRRVLSRVSEAHARGAWVTYGSFVTAAGERGFVEPYDPGAEVRKARWLGSHLKTMRAGLIQAIDPDTHLKLDGKWVHRAVDMAIMLCCLEQAGLDRSVCLRDITYVYNFASSFEASADEAAKIEEKHFEARIRAMPPMLRATNRRVAPWPTIQIAGITIDPDATADGEYFAIEPREDS